MPSGRQSYSTAWQRVRLNATASFSVCGWPICAPRQPKSLAAPRFWPIIPAATRLVGCRSCCDWQTRMSAPLRQAADLPALAIGLLHVVVGLGVVGELQLIRIPLERFAGEAASDSA